MTDLVEDYLLLWVLLAVGLGVAVPSLAVVTRASPVVLAAMIGSISLTLPLDRFRRIEARTLGLVLAGHATMPLLAFGVARGFGLPPDLTVGFVVLGAVTPELVTPVMTALADGDTALSTAVLVVAGIGSVGFVPAVVALPVGGADVPTAPIVERLLVAVVVPMLAAVGAGATLLNALGYRVGFIAGGRSAPPTRIASTLSVGMRDFAVATALVIAAGLPASASLPAVAFGVVEPVSRRARPSPPWRSASSRW